jgi:hypothetical protein
MSRKFYDDFCRKTLKDMSQSISDMTYNYKDTVVPAKHYQDLLSAELEELMASDVNIEVNLLEPYFKIISDLKKENQKLFFKALLMSEAGLKPSSLQAVEFDALDYAYNCYLANKPKDRNLLSKEILDNFNDVKEHGLTSIVEADILDIGSNNEA